MVDKWLCLGAREPGESMVSCAVREWREELGLPNACVHLRSSSGHDGSPRRSEQFHRPAILGASGIACMSCYLTPLKWQRFIAFRWQTSWRIGTAPNSPCACSHAEIRAFQWTAPGFRLPGVPFVWGATALMLSEVADWHARWAVAR